MLWFRFVRYTGLAFPLAFGGGTALAAAEHQPANQEARRLLRESPLRFEPNVGQWGPRVKFGARTGDYTLLLTAREAVLAFTQETGAIRMSLEGASASGKIEGDAPLRVRADYFLGNRPQNWRTRTAQYSRVRYRQVYPGIDVVYYGSRRQLEYDFVVQPGADPGRIRLNFQGAGRLSLTGEGDLLLEHGGKRLVQKRPAVYQQAKDGSRRDVRASYRLLGGSRVGVELGPYDRSEVLTIDPVLSYSTYLGGSGADNVIGVKADASGMLYVVGSTYNGDIPATDGAWQDVSKGKTDIFVAKINPKASGGESLQYFSYIGGSDADIPLSMDIDAAGNFYVTGSTLSTDFPMANAYQGAISGLLPSGAQATDAFVLKLNPAGSELVYSTYLGGKDADRGDGIAVDASGNVYVVGTTKADDFPVTGNAYQSVRWGSQNVFISKFDLNASPTLVYSTYLGGDLVDEGRGAAVTPSGTLYFAAATVSSVFPVRTQPIQGTYQGNMDTVIGKMDLTKSGDESLVSSTYLGGTGLDQVTDIALDPAGRLLVTGYTMSPDFPVTGDAVQKSLAGNADAFVSALDLTGPQMKLLYSTYLGGAAGDVGHGVAGDADGNIYVTGYTLSPDFPTAGQGFQNGYGGGIDAFISQLKPGSGLVYSTYFGGNGVHVGNSISVLADGTICFGGYTLTPDIPVTDSALRNTPAGGSDGFVTVISPK